MDITLPEIPLGVLALLAFFSPYAIAALNGALSFVQSAAAKRIVTIVVAVVLAALVLVFYYAMTGDVIPSWPVFVILSIMISAASYALITKPTAKKVEHAVEERVAG